MAIVKKSRSRQTSLSAKPYLRSRLAPTKVASRANKLAATCTTLAESTIGKGLSRNGSTRNPICGPARRHHRTVTHCRSPTCPTFSWNSKTSLCSPANSRATLSLTIERHVSVSVTTLASDGL